MALYLKKELENKAEIAVWQITETEEELKTLSSTPSDEIEEISWIKSETMRKQRLAVRALLNELFDEKVYLSHHDNGKPFLENRVTNISITPIKFGTIIRPLKVSEISQARVDVITAPKITVITWIILKMIVVFAPKRYSQAFEP